MAERNEYEDLRIERIIDTKVKAAIKEYDEELQKTLVNMFIIKLAKFETMYTIMKFVVVAVSTLVIGTLYQLFSSLTSTGVLK